MSLRSLVRALSLAVITSAIISASRVDAGIVVIGGGTLTISYDGSVFADVNSSYAGLTPGQDFMRYGRFWSPSETVKGAAFTAKQPQEFRPLPISGGTGNPRQPNFRDNRAQLDALYPQASPTEILGVNGNGPIANSVGRNRLSTTLTYDTSNVLGSVTGLVQTNGVSAWWFANDDIMNQGGSWVSWGDLSLRYDASRLSLGYSGWVFANQLGGVGDIFDTKNVTLIATSAGISISGELWSSDGTSPNPYNANPSTWPSYTLMNPDLKIGSFNFQGTAVPEPSALALLGSGAVALLGLRLRRRAGGR